MRISTANSFEAGIDSLQRRQQELADAQTRLTTGKRVLRASDDPSAAARAERALATEQRAQASQRALEASRNAMALAESALADAGELLQQVRETLVAAGNASYGANERGALVQRLVELRAQLLALANRGDGAGSYLFAGHGAAQAPFVDAPGGVQYRGTSGQMQAASGEPLPLTLDGAAAWLRASSGNGVFETRPVSGATAWIDAGRVDDPAQLTGARYSITFATAGGATTYSVLRDGAPTAATGVAFASGQAITIDGMSVRITGAPADGDRFDLVPSTPTLSVFDTLDRTIAELKAPHRTAPQVTQTVQAGLRDVDGSLAALQSLRAMVGETLNRADNVEGRLAALELHAQTERSSAEDLDMVHAISDFQSRQTGYDAALKTYSMVQRLSLLQYLNG